MIDPKLLRENPEQVRAALQKRGLDPEKLQLWVEGRPLQNLQPLQMLQQRDQWCREKRTDIENDRHRLKKASEQFAIEKATGKQTTAPPNLKQLSDDIGRREQGLREEERGFLDFVAGLPNIPNESVPIGDARANRIERTVGQKPSHTFTPKTHIELGLQRRWIALERSAKISG